MKSLILNLLILTSILFGGLLMPLAQAQALDCGNPTTSADQIKCGACGASGQKTCPATPTNTIGNTLRTVVNVITVFAGAIAVIMIIVGGLRYITSGGNSEGTKSARNTILYAVVGLIIVALAQIIVHFVLNNTPKA
jgi:cytochrome bd-type quinol oxidase subunit 2